MNCEFRNLGIIGTLSTRSTDSKIPQFLNPSIYDFLTPETTPLPEPFLNLLIFNRIYIFIS